MSEGSRDVTAAAGEIGTLSYETALEELDVLIARLEAGRVNLDEAISCYERGARLAQHCERLLDRTEQKVTQVVVGGAGDREQPFDPLPAPIGADNAGRVEGEGRVPRARSVGGPDPRASALGDPGRPRRPSAPPIDPDEIPF